MLKRIFVFFSSGVFFGLGFVVVFILGVGVLLSLLPGDEGFRDKVRVKTEHAVAVLDLEGEIVTSDKFVRRLNKQIEDPGIKGVVVRINSPGGGVGASEALYNAIKMAGERKPVVCALEGVAASGGLYSAVGCKKIVTQKGTLSGSIGVIFMTPAVAPVLDKIGVSMNVVKSGKLKDVGSPFRPMTEEDRNFLEGLINTSYVQFLTTVATSRGLDVEKVRPVADGRIILGEELVKLGLADEIGGIERAAEVVLELAGIKGKPEIVYPGKRVSIIDRFFDSESAAGLLFQFQSLFRSRLLYKAFI